MSRSGKPSPEGFFGALFDFSFTRFITPIIIKVVYVLAAVALLVTWVVLTVVGFLSDPASGVLFLVGGAIMAVLYLAFIRMTLEFYIAIVRMSEDIHHRLPQ